jgi:hypothetical protein
MSDNFKYQCRSRRSVPREETLGAGSGGDGGDGNVCHYNDQTFCVSSNDVSLLAGYGDDKHLFGTIDLLACGGMDAPQGTVSVRGDQGVRITSGPYNAPEAGNKQINGLEMQTGDQQAILIARGLDGNPMQGRLSFNPDGIGINAQQGGVWIKSLTQIKLMVAGGTSSITLTPTGIVMQGPLIKIN